MKKKIVNLSNNKLVGIILVLLCILLLVVMCISISKSIYNSRESNNEYIDYLKNKLEEASENNLEIVIYGGTVSENVDDTYKDQLVTDYTSYLNIVDYYGIKKSLTEDEFVNYSYVLVIPEIDDCSGTINRVEIDNLSVNKLDLNIKYDGSCGVCAPTYEIYFVPISKELNIRSINVTYNYIEENKNEYNCDDLNNNENFIDTDKPLIYLYPETQMQVEVKLGNIKDVTTTYPKYEDNWRVLANPNGNLIDLKTGRNLYGLYWEGKRITDNTNLTEGFVVKKEDTISFLEEKLAILGLNEREANEFIIYWLPQLEENNYNFIRFLSIEEINEYMPLEISPTPDTIIRVLMEFKGLDERVEVKEQKLETPKREGFVVVEWGGSKLD